MWPASCPSGPSTLRGRAWRACSSPATTWPSAPQRAAPWEPASRQAPKCDRLGTAQPEPPPALRSGAAIGRGCCARPQAPGCEAVGRPGSADVAPPQAARCAAACGLGRAGQQSPRLWHVGPESAWQAPCGMPAGGEDTALCSGQADCPASEARKASAGQGFRPGVRGSGSGWQLGCLPVCPSQCMAE